MLLRAGRIPSLESSNAGKCGYEDIANIDVDACQKSLAISTSGKKSTTTPYFSDMEKAPLISWFDVSRTSI